MMKQVIRLSVFVVAVLAFASQASAQALPWEGRGFINVNFGLQVMTEDATTTTASFDAYGETGTPDHLAGDGQPGGAAGSRRRFRIAGNFGFGFAYSRVSAPGSATVEAKIPSPIYYDQPRTATAALDDLEHVEDGYHFQLLWMIPVTDKFDIMLSGGPTMFNLKQGIVTSPDYGRESAPLTTRSP